MTVNHRMDTGLPPRCKLARAVMPVISTTHLTGSDNHRLSATEALRSIGFCTVGALSTWILYTNPWSYQSMRGDSDGSRNLCNEPASLPANILHPPMWPDWTMIAMRPLNCLRQVSQILNHIHKAFNRNNNTHTIYAYKETFQAR